MARFLHRGLTAIRLLQAALFHYGPALLAKYTGPCSWLLCALALGAGLYDLIHRRRFDAFLWAFTSALLWTSFRLEGSLYSPHWSEAFAFATLAVALLLLSRTVIAVVRTRG